MPILDHSPSKNRVRWNDIQIVYENEIHTIKNGYTDKLYVYWDRKTPNLLLSSDELPIEYVGIVFVNNGGIHTIYPDTNLKVVGSEGLELKYEYIEKSVSSLREYTTTLNERVSSIEQQIISIRAMLDKINSSLG